MSESQTSIEPPSVESPQPKVRIVVPTTPVQRREAYRIYQATGDWQAACRQTRMAPQTFWYWMKRAAEEGATALDAYQSCAHHAHLYEIAPEIVAEVRQGHAAHPEWGKRHLVYSIIEKRATR